MSNPISRRRLLGGALGAAALGAFGACGSNKGAGSQASGGASGSAAKVTLEQWYHQYGEEGTQAAVKKYAAGYPDATVNVQWIPGDYPTKLASGLSSGEGPDAFEGHLDRSMVTSEQIVALDDLIADVKSDFDPADIEANSVGGKLYSIPMINDPQVFYYRKSLLAEKGIQPPTSFADLISAAKELTTDKVKGLFIGNDASTTGGAIGQPMVYATGGRFLNADNTKVGFDPDRVGAAVAQIRTLAADKSLLLGAPTDWWDPSAINDGLTAIQWQGMWALPAMQEALPDDIGVFALPAADAQGKQAVSTSGWSAFVNAKSAHLDEAKAFTKWLWVDSVELQEDWSLNYGFHIPPRLSVAAKAGKLSDGVAAETVKLNTDFGVRGNPSFTPAMQTAYNDAVGRIVAKGADPSTEMAAAVKKIEAELDKQNG